MEEEKKKIIEFLGIIPSIILAIVIVMVAIVIIADLSKLITSGVNYLEFLLNNASMLPTRDNRFSNFIQLLLIAVFIGWVINRFKRK